MCIIKACVKHILQASGVLFITFVSKKEAVDLARTRIRQWMDSMDLLTRIHQWMDSLDLVTRIRQWMDSLGVTSLEGPSLPRYWGNRVEPGLQMETLNTVNPSTQMRPHNSVEPRNSLEPINRFEPENRLEPVNRVEPGLRPTGSGWQIW